MNYIKPEDIKEYVSKNPEGIAGMSEELAVMVNHFAELIVKECMRMCDVADMSLLEHNCVKEASGTQSAKDFIKEHFGVEE
jgi:hypothetical protein